MGAVKKPSFTGNVKKTDFHRNKLVIHYHLRRNWNQSDVLGIWSISYKDIKNLPRYNGCDSDGNYINDRNGSLSFREINIPSCSETIVIIFQNSFAGQTDTFGDPQYPEDDIVGIFRHMGPSPIKVKYMSW